MAAPWADVIYGCDRKWWLEYHDRAHKRCRGEFWTTNRSVADVFRINLIHSEPGGGSSNRPGWIKQGGNSGFQALSLALLFGASRVILLGYDMQFTAGRKHWHGDHPETLGNPVDRKFIEWRQRFASLAQSSKVPIINASRATALDCFPRQDLHACLAEPSALGS